MSQQQLNPVITSASYFDTNGTMTANIDLTSSTAAIMSTTIMNVSSLFLQPLTIFNQDLSIQLNLTASSVQFLSNTSLLITLSNAEYQALHAQVNAVDVFLPMSLAYGTNDTVFPLAHHCLCLSHSYLSIDAHLCCI